jgi:hypothetical protein
MTKFNYKKLLLKDTKKKYSQDRMVCKFSLNQDR